ncbi:MAPEG family protein [Sulfitobacter aestuariivivens]|uniref:MAPEG family protein n=1 Tax=Sulfitobacter aestuariivivens TaxID=2766981 RepID=A0A927DAJ9_9RHOB|nr:MAPEG family protein [Sulfitobacter aestuariivivens]MBD3665716.1 MAPEG family protein [Sulfitobacter aestuariivivens]
MPLETALVWFGVITFIVIGVEIMYTYATRGFGFGFSSNRPASVEKSPLGLRIERVYRNQVEASAYVVPILGGAALMGLATPAAQTAALLVVLGRAAFCVLYYTGIPFIRVLAFLTVSLSLLFILYTLATMG